LAGDALYSGRGDPADGRGRRRRRGHPPARMDPNSTALSLQAVKDYPRRFAIMGAHDLLFQPMALDRMDTHHLMSPGHMPNLKRMPRDIIAAGRYFHGFDTWECSIEFCGEDMWLFASDWPHATPAGRKGCSRPPIGRASATAHGGKSSARTQRAFARACAADKSSPAPRRRTRSCGSSR
jgi:hypothetical protein